MVKKIRLVIPVLILTAGMVMMIIGIQRGELQSILQKGVVVCLECIGIG